MRELDFSHATPAITTLTAVFRYDGLPQPVHVTIARDFDDDEMVDDGDCNRWFATESEMRDDPDFMGVVCDDAYLGDNEYTGFLPW